MSNESLMFPERSSPSHSSNDSAQFDSDTTELHTIVYDAPLVREPFMLYVWKFRSNFEKGNNNVTFTT